MANISEEKWIEMLEKKEDGTFVAKYPKVKSKTGVTFDEHLADKTQHIDTLVQEIIVTSPVTSIIFNNLDGHLDGGYLLVSELISTAPGNTDISLFVENDRVATNYRTQFTIGGTAQDRNSFFRTQPGNNIVHTEITISNGGVFSAISMSLVGDTNFNVTAIQKKSSITNITKLEIFFTIADSINVGSRVRLYRRKNHD